MEKSSSESSLNLEEILKNALVAVKAGRELLLSYYGQIKNIEFKEKAGLVSEADKETEKLIFNQLKVFHPDFEFVGEEMSYENNVSEFSKTAKPRWILDPLDGTTNYIHQFPLWCISLALEFNEELQIGIIDVPLLNQTFTAIKGHGAYCNSQKISVSKTTDLNHAFLTTGFIADEPSVLKEQLKIFEHFVWKSRAIRRPGSAAYDLALVAQGVFDLYWEKNIKPWDIAAGVLLVQEAGGICLNYQGQIASQWSNSLIAGPPTLVQTFSNELKPIIQI